MSTQINREAFEKLVKEDIDWLLTMPDTLERGHIISVLRNTPDLIYGPACVDTKNIDKK